MKPFRAKLNHQFVEQDFIDAAVWATYYEPDDIDALVELGFDRQDVERVVLRTKNNDEYSFPLPVGAAASPFHYLYLSVRATTKGGIGLVGYLTGPCFGVFHAGKHYQFNTLLRERTARASAELAKALGEEAAFPMQIQVIATGERKELKLW
jgi:hypothetical protein